MKNYLLLLLLILAGLSANCQIFINEFSASNTSIIDDPNFQEYSDWVELYNISNTTINLNGYYISDNISKPDKWQITSNINIPAKGYALIWCDNESTGIHTNFKLSADGEEIIISTPDLKILDSLTYGKQEPDISYGRIASSPAKWGYFNKPTPNKINNTKAYNGIVYNTPEFSLRGGMYKGAITTEINTLFGGEIRYTTNGSEPDANSNLYTNTLNFSQTVILRARIFKPDSIPGPVVTQSYFINENSVNAKLPVVSIATNPDNFWGAETGIYVQNFKPEWSVPINIEFFENNGSDRAAFNLTAGTKVNGLHSWQLPQKMLGVYFKKEFGESKLEYPLFLQRPRGSFKSFALRASGSDWSYTLMRDMLGHHATLLNMDIDIMSFKPSVVYVNGEFLGIHNIREKVDDDYIAKSYGLDADSIDMVENEDYAEAGDLLAYKDFLGYVNKDLSIKSNFDQVAELMDIENFTDYIITEMCTGNTSISHNVMAWKPKEGGKWRWILMDLDRGFSSTSRLVSFYLSQNVWPLDNLFDNKAYVDYFGKRLAAHLFTSFNPIQISKLVDEHSSLIEDEIPRHIARWQGTTSSYGNAIPSVDDWYRQVHKIKNYAQNRPAALLSDLKNYGFDETATLSLSVEPADAGKLSIDNLKITEPNTCGLYLLNEKVVLNAEPTPGYDFKGWTLANEKVLINKSDEWKYYDKGQLPAASWFNNSFDDTNWKTGKGQFGYGDGDENTEITYFNNNGDVYLTTYFRKNISITQEQLDKGMFIIDILKDDGAVIYINSVEVFRLNIGYGDISYESLAAYNMSGDAEDTYNSYFIDAKNFIVGKNTIAVEIHQESGSKSDISFDMSLTALMPNSNNIVSTQKEYTFTFTDTTHLIAQFERNSVCITPPLIESNLTLSKDCSPYFAQGDIVVPENSTLTIEPGVELYMPKNASIYVSGQLMALGTENEEIIFSINPNMDEEQWGSITFKNSADTSFLKYVTIEGASHGDDVTFENAAISAFSATLILDHLSMINNFGNPIVARYSDITLTNSNLHSDATGDLINVKYGKAFVANCVFKGNDKPDTDAIDYDEVTNGVIRNCTISDFWGFNSDAVDIGEKASNILIDSLWVYKITDKGVSVGQQSTVSIQNSVFVNCNMGVAVKDSSQAMIDRSIFYSNVNGIACYEKVLGRAGGNAKVTNSIISNSSEKSGYNDSKSSLLIEQTLSDTDTLNLKSSNITDNPLFKNPSHFDFELKVNSPAKNAGVYHGQTIDLGVKHAPFTWNADIMISQIFINPNGLDFPEFISLYNPNNYNMDISGYRITKGVTAEIPQGTTIEANSVVFVTENNRSLRWNIQTKPVIQWTEGKLSNNGEGIQLEDNYGIVIDYFKYKNNGLWPTEIFTEQKIMTLISPYLDNHFAESWNSIAIDEIQSEPILMADEGRFKVYPSPTQGVLNIQNEQTHVKFGQIFNLTGQQVAEFKLSDKGFVQVDITHLPNGIYFVKIGYESKKVLKAN